MLPENQGYGSTRASDEELVLSSLELEQLSARKKQPIPRRHLRGFEKLLLWSLRIYVLFMIVVVLYQVFTGAR